MKVRSAPLSSRSALQHLVQACSQFPGFFSALGLILGFACMVVTASVSLLSQQMLANAAYATGLNNYGSVTRRALGKAASNVLNGFVFVYTYGCVVGAFVFLEQLGPQLCWSLGLPAFLSEDKTGQNLIMLLCIPLSPLCALRSLASLRYATALSVCALVIVAVMVFMIAPQNYSEMTRHHEREHTGDADALSLLWVLSPHVDKWETVPQVLAFSFYAFCCHVSLFAKYRELDDPSARRVNKALVRSVALEATIYSLIGACGFLSFGSPCAEEVPKNKWPSCTPVNVLASPRFGGASGVTARLCMLVAIFVAIPVNVHAGREILDEHTIKKVMRKRLRKEQMQEQQEESGSHAQSTSHEATPNRNRQSAADDTLDNIILHDETPILWHVTASLMYLYMTCLTAIVYSNISSILGVIGGGCAVSFMFTFPTMATLSLYFRRIVTADGPVRRGILGRRSDPGTPQIGRFLGVTKRGVITAAIITGPCILMGYTSAILSLKNIIVSISSA